MKWIFLNVESVYFFFNAVKLFRCDNFSKRFWHTRETIVIVVIFCYITEYKNIGRWWYYWLVVVIQVCKYAWTKQEWQRIKIKFVWAIQFYLYGLVCCSLSSISILYNCEVWQSYTSWHDHKLNDAVLWGYNTIEVYLAIYT